MRQPTREEFERRSRIELSAAEEEYDRRHAPRPRGRKPKAKKRDEGPVIFGGHDERPPIRTPEELRARVEAEIERKGGRPEVPEAREEAQGRHPVSAAELAFLRLFFLVLTVLIVMFSFNPELFE